MNKFTKFVKSIGERITAKSYSGVLPGNLPSNTKWGTNDFLKANDISLYTNKAVAKRAEKVGEIEFILKDKAGNVIENDPILDLLKKPNKKFDAFHFWELYQKHLDLTGSAYILLDGGEREIFETKKVTAMHLLMPNRVKVEHDANGDVTRYIYRLNGGSEITYTADQVIHIYTPDPKAPLSGISLLQAGIQAIQTEVQIGAYHSRVLENGGKVEGLFKFKTARISQTQLQELKEQYKKEYADARKAGTPLFMGGDSDYVKTGLTPDELGYLEAKKTTLEDICIMTGVPKPILASYEGIQYSNADAAIRVFLKETIKPLLRGLTAALDNKLVSDGRTLTFIDPTPENVEERIKETDSGIKSYYITINEARERHGYDALPDGDVLLVPFNMIPLGAQSVVNDGGEEKRFKAVAHPLQNADTRKVYGDMQVKRMDAREKVFAVVLKKYFDEQETRLVDMLQPTKTRIFRTKGLFDEILSIELEARLGKEALLPVIAELLKDAGIDAMELIGASAAFNVTADITSWMEKRTDVFVRQINETTFTKLKDEFATSLAGGENRQELIDRIENTYGDINQHRAATIARTEVHNATQYGTMQGYKQAGMNIKIWVTVGDSAVRDSHKSLDGQERPIDVPFSNGLMLPGDPSGSAEDVINCRCTI